MSKVIGCLLVLCTQLHASAQFRNVDFSDRCDTSKTGLCYWDLSWGAKGSVQPEILEQHNTMRLLGKSASSVAFAEQSAVIPFAMDLRIVTVSVFMKTDSVSGRGAGLNIGLYYNSDELIANRDMGGYYSLDWRTGSTGWKKESISIVCPAHVTKVKIGAILYGTGTAWFRDYQVSVSPLTSKKPSRVARRYVRDALDSIITHSLVRDSLDEKQLYSTAVRIAGRAKRYSDCYLAINYLLESLREYGDHHSFFMKPAEVRNWESAGSKVSKLQYASGKVIDGIGYILVPAFHGGNPEHILQFADSLQKTIQNLYATGIKGWIVDLSENTGGNMSPMVAGLGPLFSSDTLGYLVDVNKKRNGWFYSKGKYYWNDSPGMEVTSPVTLSLRLPIAVLTGPQTGSSGEAVAISFIANQNTRSFGKSTWGLTTGNGSFALPDGSQIYLASTIMADRTGKLYPHGISPDEPVTGKTEEMIQAATKWILSQYK